MTACMTETSLPRQLLSLSRTSIVLELSPKQVIRIANLLGVQPDLFIDEAFFYSDETVARIREQRDLERAAKGA